MSPPRSARRSRRISAHAELTDIRYWSPNNHSTRRSSQFRAGLCQIAKPVARFLTPSDRFDNPSATAMIGAGPERLCRICLFTPN